MQDILTKVLNSTRIKFLFVPQMNYNPGRKLINIQYEPKPQINNLLSEIYKLEFLFNYILKYHFKSFLRTGGIHSMNNCAHRSYLTREKKKQVKQYLSTGEPKTK